MGTKRTKTTFTITLTQGPEGLVTAVCKELPGCFSQGKTQSSALANITEAIRAVLKVKAAKQFPEAR